MDCTCGTDCGRKAAMRHGKPAYKGGLSARCYKEDVARRRGEPVKVEIPKKPVLDPMDAPGSKASHKRADVKPLDKLSWCLDGHHPGVEKPEDLSEGPGFGYWATCPGTLEIKSNGQTLVCACACHAK